LNFNHTTPHPAGQCREKAGRMFVVYEVFKTDGKKFYRFESEDKFDCEVYVYHHIYDYGALLNGKSILVIEEV
jgi:hypothetical protein